MREYLDGGGYLDWDGSYNEYYRKSRPVQMPNPKGSRVTNPRRNRFLGKTPEEYMSWKQIDKSDHTDILEAFKLKYPNHGNLSAKRTKTKMYEADWNRFLHFVKDYLCS